MSFLKQGPPLIVALGFGLSTLLGLLFVPSLAHTLLGWGTLLAAVALLFGVLNLFFIHAGRLFQGNLYSGVLVLSMLTVLILAVLDGLELTQGAADLAFHWVQAPIEATLAALLAFFLLFAAARLLHRRPNRWSFIFFITLVIILISQSPLPEAAANWIGWLGDILTIVFAGAGMRGLLIGVALGAVTIATRILVGMERPYNQ
jgi:hypothetical protein